MADVGSRLPFVVPALRLEVEQSPAASEWVRGVTAVRVVGRRRDVVDFVVVRQTALHLCRAQHTASVSIVSASLSIPA